MVSAGLFLSLWCFATRRNLRPDGVLPVAQLWARLCLRSLKLFCGVTIEARGMENLPPGGVIIAAQHQSELDILIWLVLLSRPAFVFKQELRKIPFFGALLVPAGMVPVNRGGGPATLRDMVAGCERALAQGRQVVIFPEGTRTAPGTRKRLRNGIVALADAAAAPLLPAATNTGLRWGPNPFTKTPGLARLRLFPPLSPGLSREALMGTLECVFYEQGLD